MSGEVTVVLAKQSLTLVQAPASHVPLGQLVLHLPQFLASVCRSVQALPQTVLLSAHLHAPASQVAVSGQATPQPLVPQCAGLVRISVLDRHTPPHSL